MLWAELDELAAFKDPGPALVYVAIRNDGVGRDLVRALVRHHAERRGSALSSEPSERTSEGVRLLDGLINEAGLEPEDRIGPHSLSDLVTATWAVAAATGRD